MKRAALLILLMISLGQMGSTPLQAQPVSRPQQPAQPASAQPQKPAQPVGVRPQPQAQPAGEKLLVMESLSLNSRILGREVHYSVCLPEGYYNSNQSYPVNYLLHGFGDDQTGWLEYGSIWNLATKAVAEGDAMPMIYIMPEGFNTYYVNDYTGTFRYEDMFIQEFIPAIDSLYRTIKAPQGRAVTGYSMGGFGAMMLYLNHTDVFGACVPLSMSVRTDAQYMTEEASGWDGQWGRLFGAPGLTGSDRITEYYRQNSPFHFIPAMSSSQKQNLKIYMLNGDDEETLCRSNEELHILMDSVGIPHQYRVVNGGHSFRVWRTAMPDALRFVSDVFERKPYRGDKALSSTVNSTVPAGPQPITKQDSNKSSNGVKAPEMPGFIKVQIPGVSEIRVPAEYSISDRNFPVVLVSGISNPAERAAFTMLVYNHPAVTDNCPLILVYLTPEGAGDIKTTFEKLEQNVRIRRGNKYRSMITANGSAQEALLQASALIPLNTMVITDGRLTRAEAGAFTGNNETEQFRRMRLFIDAPAAGHSGAGNGTLHMRLRDTGHSHEYRVRQGTGGFKWSLQGMDEAIEYIIINFHR